MTKVSMIVMKVIATKVSVIVARVAMIVTEAGIPAVVIPLCLAACGGSGGTRFEGNGNQLEPIDYCAEAARYEFFPIGNAPQAMGTIADPFDARNGPGWYASKDASPNSDMKPSGTPSQEEAPGTRCGRPINAIRVAAVGLRDWGANIGYNFDLNAAVDGSALQGWLSAPQNEFDVTPGELEGLSFWARLASCETDPPVTLERAGRSPCEDKIPLGTTLFASVTDAFTTETDGCGNTSEGCYCLFDPPTPIPDEPEPDPMTFQCDAFGTGVGLGPEWRFFTLNFDEMRQRGFGKPSQQSTPGPDLLGVSFNIEIGTWDLWLDDIAFFRTLPDDSAE